MFAQTLNELRVELEIRPESPLLIKDGRHHEEGQKDRLFFHRGVRRAPERPRRREGRGYGDYGTPEESFDMAFVYSRTARGQDRFYIPGGSLRGVLRTTAERTIARWRPDLVTDPFAAVGHPLAGSDQKLIAEYGDTRRPSGATIYCRAAPIERCFGHTLLRGRWTIADAWMKDDQQASPIVRDGVGISRRTGAAEQDIKFQFEAITGGVFTTTLTLVNYELWQLGLLAHVLAALDGGQARLGYGTRRGLGRVRLRVGRMLWRSYRRSVASPVEGLLPIPTLARLAAEAEIANHGAYGFQDGELSLELPLVPGDPRGALVPKWTIDPPEAEDPWCGVPWPQCGPLLPQALRAWPQRAEAES
jgi:CRISPR/Cas system CSM-associated protein Csm3 (group 7 of RAMP superfamily)